MTDTTLIALALCVFAWSVTSEWLAARNITGPVVLLVAGVVLANPDWGLVPVDADSGRVHFVAELTLALLLFADASKVAVRAARHDLPITSRLLGIGLPLSIIAGAALALVLFPDLPLPLAALLAASLAPTDAALSAAVVNDERLPATVRRVLNVESGLNDGIATPVVTTCIAAAATVLAVVQDRHESGLRAGLAILVGIVVGVVLAGVGGRLMVLAHDRGWVQHGARRLGTTWLALGSFFVAAELGGNPFVAAFVGGLTFGAVVRHDAEPSIELTELMGTLLSLALWFVFGAAFVLPALEQLDVRTLAYAVASLTVVRMVPVALSLLGSGLDRATVLFLGWFGPRGLASVVFGLLTLEELGATRDPRVAQVLRTMSITIVLSVLLHGATGRPFTRRYLERTSATRPSPSP